VKSRLEEVVRPALARSSGSDDLFQSKSAEKKPLNAIQVTNTLYQLLVLHGELFACRSWSASTSSCECVFKWDAAAGRFLPFTVSPADLCPGLNLIGVAMRFKRPLTLPDGRVLTLGVESVYDHQWKPNSLYLLSALQAGGAAKVTLPGNALPCDLVLRGAALSVLGYDAAAKQIVVFSLDAHNPQSAPTETLRFSSPTYARSFEELNNTFYFGLGCDDTNLSASSDEIWKAVPVAAPAPTTAPIATPIPTPTLAPTPTLVPVAAPVATPTPVPAVLPTPTPTAPLVVVTPQPVILSSGLNAAYFPNRDQSGSPVA